MRRRSELDAARLPAEYSAGFLKSGQKQDTVIRSEYRTMSFEQRRRKCTKHSRYSEVSVR